MQGQSPARDFAVPIGASGRPCRVKKNHVKSPFHAFHNWPKILVIEWIIFRFVLFSLPSRSTASKRHGSQTSGFTACWPLPSKTTALSTSRLRCAAAHSLFCESLLNILLQGHADLAPHIVFDFEEGLGEVPVVGWAGMLAALMALLRPFLLPSQDPTAKLKRLWAYVQGETRRSVFPFCFYLLASPLLSSPLHSNPFPSAEFSHSVAQHCRQHQARRQARAWSCGTSGRPRF
jgi:hypothetical protein